MFVEDECNTLHTFNGELVFYVRRHIGAIRPYNQYEFKYVMRGAKRFDGDEERPESPASVKTSLFI